MNLQNREGQTVPSVVFRTRRDHEWVDATSDEVFRGKTVVVFALPLSLIHISEPTRQLTQSRMPSCG